MTPSPFDDVIAFSPADTCLNISVDGQPLYRHDGDIGLIPASTQKLLTARIALEDLGPDTTYETRVVASAAPVDGVVNGDITIIGSGDPVLVTDTYRLVDRIGEGAPVTSFDTIAPALRDAGITRITGRVLGDESRYDAARSVATWPENYVRENQSGPLSALTVDDGFDLTIPGGDAPVRRDRAADPAASAARLLAGRLLFAGIAVDGAGFSGAGSAPADPVILASVTSPPVSDLVHEMLLVSDNQIAELLTKEIGRQSGTAGTTEAGVAVIEARSAQLGLDRTNARAIDGSGLDRGNRETCDALVALLDDVGSDSAIGAALPIAGETGTLSRRFRDNPAAGSVRAKTGSLNGVASLAGFVALPGGGEATFAYIANEPDGPIRAPFDLLGDLLGTLQPPCPAAQRGGAVAPISPYAGLVGNLAMFPLQSAVVPGAIVPLHVFEDRYRILVDRCVALEEDFGFTLISHGSEVGGNDVRTDVGTRARIVEAQQSPDGRWAVIALGLARIRVNAWHDDDPHPLADVVDWPDDPSAADQTAPLLATAGRLRTLLALQRRLGDPGPAPEAVTSFDPATDDATMASFRLAALAPIGDLDRHRLLAAPTVAERLALLDDAIEGQELVARHRLGGP